MKARSIFAGFVSLPLLFSPSVIAAPGARLSALQKCAEKALTGADIENRIIAPSEDTYTAASTGVILFQQFPAMIVYATSVEEISPLVNCATANGYKVTPRTGGHHFENWSALNGTLVVDISHIDYLKLAEDKETATIGAGARLGTIYSLLNGSGKTFNGGICPSVGLGGYLGVGGYNMQMRELGMAIDHIASAKIVLASGELVTASPNQHSDLFYAIRGGGMYGFIVEVTIKLVTIPRSAMLWMNFTTNRYQATQKYLDWASKQDPKFNSQLNLYSDRVGVLGWYIGKSAAELTNIVKTSGLLDIPGGQVKITDNCSTENSRNFWVYTQTECTDDETAHELFNTWYNIVPDDLAPVAGVSNYAFDDVPALPKEPKAQLWPRISLINKTYFITKSRPLTPDIIKYITSTSGALPLELNFWTEMTSFNISTPATGSFPWQEEAEYLFRFEVNRSENKTLNAIGQKFMDDLDAYLVPKIGTASYAGYTDSAISTNPVTSYWGDNVCKLSAIKKRYDPTNFFTNPFQIGPAPPNGVHC